MRAEILKHWQIGAAILFAVVLIGGAYALAHELIAPEVAQASTQTELLKAIASKDSDNDGLPDWQETLYGTDPHNPDTFHLGMTDGEAVAKGLIVPKAIIDLPVASSTANSGDIVDPSLPPAPADGTLTAQFAQLFFTNFLAARQANGGVDLSESQLNDIANQTMSTFLSTVKAAPDYKSINDLTISDSGPDAMKAFAVSAEAILLKNTNDATTTDINYFKSALIDGDSSAYEHILSIAKSYRGSAAGLAALPVPPELAQADLLLMNTLMRMSGIDIDFAKAETDPLATMLALEQYQTVVTALGRSFVSIGNVYADSGVSVPSGSSGALFIHMIADIQASQGAKAKLP